MAQEQIKIYVGCALSKAPQEFVHNVESFKASLREKGYYVYDFVGTVKGTARDVYSWDIMYCVYNCDIFVAICDEPSIGLGWELAEATRFRKPILAAAHKDARVTRMISGAAESEPNMQFMRYSEMLDLMPSIDKLAKVAAKDKAQIHELMDPQNQDNLIN